MDERADVVVVGGGPAGLSAALESGRWGLSVVVLDENARTGGQIFRQPPNTFKRAPGLKKTRQWLEGQSLIESVNTSPVHVLTRATVWGSLSPGSIEVMVDSENRRFEYRALVVAAGASDRPVPVPGWTLPGVMTAGGAQALLKSQGVLPGRRILMAGAGPLQLVVASQFCRAGAGLVAVAEAVPIRAHLRHLADLIHGGASLVDGLRYRWDVARARVPWFSPMVIKSIHGEDRVVGATIVRADPEWRPIPGTELSFEVDTVCLGYGLVPSVELLRHLGCDLAYDGVGDAWVPKRTEDCETTLPGVFAVGDGAGVAGVKIAMAEGQLAGMAIARNLVSGAASNLASRMSRTRKRLQRMGRFANAMNSAYGVRPGLYSNRIPSTPVCRCEEVTEGELRAAIAAGATELVQLKASTRIGMGPCQARMCGAAASHLLASKTQRGIEEIGCFSSRVPIRPIPLSGLLHACDYVREDVPAFQPPSVDRHQES